MWVFIARRLLSAIPVICLTSVIVFLLMRLLPGNPVLTLIAQSQSNVDEAAVQSIIVANNLDQPLYKQYFIWVGTLLTGDLGRSIINNQPVTEVLSSRLMPTLQIGLTAWFLTMLL